MDHAPILPNTGLRRKIRGTTQLEQMTQLGKILFYSQASFTQFLFPPQRFSRARFLHVFTKFFCFFFVGVAFYFFFHSDNFYHAFFPGVFQETYGERKTIPRAYCIFRGKNAVDPKNFPQLERTSSMKKHCL